MNMPLLASTSDYPYMMTALLGIIPIVMTIIIGIMSFFLKRYVDHVDQNFTRLNSTILNHNEKVDSVISSLKISMASLRKDYKMNKHICAKRHYRIDKMLEEFSLYVKSQELQKKMSDEKGAN